MNREIVRLFFGCVCGALVAVSTVYLMDEYRSRTLRIQKLQIVSAAGVVVGEIAAEPAGISLRLTSNDKSSQILLEFQDNVGVLEK